jgi:hypothetical protein
MYNVYKTKEELLIENTVIPDVDLNDVPAENNDWFQMRISMYSRLNQDEMRYDDLINGTTTWPDAIEAIKTLHPKPEGSA